MPWVWGKIARWALFKHYRHLSKIVTKYSKSQIRIAAHKSLDGLFDAAWVGNKNAPVDDTSDGDPNNG
jgi:hypothetical protein